MDNQDEEINCFMPNKIGWVKHVPMGRPGIKASELRAKLKENGFSYSPTTNGIRTAHAAGLIELEMFGVLRGGALVDRNHGAALRYERRIWR